MREAHRALREATATAHEALDALFGGFDLGDRASYARFLAAHAEAALPLEAALDAAGGGRVTADWPERRRGHLLRADLADLSHPHDTSGATPPALASLPEIAGALYVLEGSRLGGRLLARRVAPGLPKRYLDADQRPGAWPKLLEQLDTILYDAPARQGAIAAALEVFAAFERSGRTWLSRI